MRIDKIKALTIAELQKEYADRKEKLHDYQLDLKSGKEKDTAKVKTLRHDIARILTLINLKTLAGEIKSQLPEVTVAEKEAVKAEVTEKVEAAKKKEAKPEAKKETKTETKKVTKKETKNKK